MSVSVIDTIKPKNGGSFPVVEAADVSVGAQRLPAALAAKAEQSALEAVGAAVSAKAEQSTVDAIIEAVSGKANQSAVDTVITSVSSKASQSALNATNATVAMKANSSDLASTNATLLNKADKSELSAAVADLQGQIDNIVTPVTEDAEVENARIGADGSSYQSLKDRLDTENGILTSNIARIDSKLSGAYTNLYNAATVHMGVEIDSHNISQDTSSEGYFSSALIKVKPNTKYNIWCGDAATPNHRSYILVVFGESDYTFISSTALPATTYLEFTTPENCEYMRFQGSSSVSVYDGSGKMYEKAMVFEDPFRPYKFYGYNTMISVEDNEQNCKYDFKNYCKRIVDNGDYSPANVESKSGESVQILEDGLNEFGHPMKKIIVSGTSEAYVYVKLLHPIPSEDVESITVRIKTPLPTLSPTGKHSGYMGFAPKTDERAEPLPVEYKIFSNGTTEAGEYFWKIPKSKFATSYFTGNLEGFYLKCIPRNSVESWYGGWTIVDVIVNQKMKPCVLLNFDQIWYESDDNGGYQYLNENGVKYTMFAHGYTNFAERSKEIAKEMELFGNEMSGYGGLSIGESLTPTQVAAIVEDNIIDVSSITEQPMKTYGCRQHNGNSVLVNQLRAKGVNAIRMTTSTFPIGCFGAKDYAIPATEITSDKSVADIKSMIDNAILEGSCLPLFTHGVCANGHTYMEFNDGTLSTSEGTPVDKMVAIADYIKAKIEAGQLESLTFADFVKSCY